MSEVREQIIEALKVRFPEPWFCGWDVDYKFDGNGQRYSFAVVSLTRGVFEYRIDHGYLAGRREFTAARVPYNDEAALLTAVESLPHPAKVEGDGDAEWLCNVLAMVMTKPENRQRCKAIASRISSFTADRDRLRKDADAFRRITEWLDCEEGRTLGLVSANAEFGGPAYAISYETLMSDGVRHVFGASRDSIMRQIENETSAKPTEPTE